MNSRVLAGGASTNWGGRRDADIPSLLSLHSWQETWADAGRRLATNRKFCRASLKLRLKPWASSLPLRRVWYPGGLALGGTQEDWHLGASSWSLHLLIRLRGKLMNAKES